MELFYMESYENLVFVDNKEKEISIIKSRFRSLKTIKMSHPDETKQSLFDIFHVLEHGDQSGISLGDAN